MKIVSNSDEVVCLDSAAAAGITAYCEGLRPEEACGVLFGRQNGTECIISITGFQPIRNAASEPLIRFEFDAGEWAAALLKKRSEGEQLVGIFHSHPAGPDYPSDEDRRLEWGFPAYMLVAFRKDKKKPSIRCFGSLPGSVWREQKVMIRNG